MRVERFQRLLEAQGPFASIYFDDSYDMANPAADLDVRWRDLSHLLHQHGVQPGLTAVVKGAVLGARPPVGPSGRCVIATSDGVLIQEHLPWSEPTPVVRVSELPFILPLVRHSNGRHTYLLVAVDHIGADITLHRGDVATTETVDPGGYPVHKAARADNREYGEAQRRVDEMFRKNIKGVADHVTKLAQKSGAEAVFVVGEVSSRAALIAALPGRIAQRAIPVRVGTRHTIADERARAAIEAEFDRRQDMVADGDADRVTAEMNRESGLAVEGLGPVCAALRDGAVDTLLVGDLKDLTVVTDGNVSHLAPNADVLSELGAAPTSVVRADEALPLAAVAIDASIICTGTRINLVDGVGALLRYPESSAASGTSAVGRSGIGDRG